MAKGIKNMTSNEFIQAFKDALISTSYRKAFMKGYSKASNSAVKQ